MDGKITFRSLENLADFLMHFQGATAKFNVEEIERDVWVLTFTGGY